MKKSIGKFSVLVIFGMLVGMSVLPGQVAAEIEVIITEENGMECALVTFEGGENWAPIPPIPEVGFTTDWITTYGGPYINEPTPDTVGLWMTGECAEIFFDDPICAISFYYASVPDVTLEAFGEGGNMLAAAIGNGNYDGISDVLNTWDPIGVNVGQNIITHVVIYGGSYLTYIDDLKVFRIIDPSVAIENLIDEIDNMDLNEGNINSFLSKLDNILKSLENENDDVAINQLEALINAIEAQRGNKLTDEEADALVAAAQNIIDYINGV